MRKRLWGKDAGKEKREDIENTRGRDTGESQNRGKGRQRMTPRGRCRAGKT